ncbi:MAG: type II toxin-antitoxin system VapC family toxin, partial [Pseudonocardiaceae bacterium]
LDRVWELRENLTVYDGWYVALAESLETSLVTADPRLAQVSGPRCPVVEVTQFVAESPELPPPRSHPE